MDSHYPNPHPQLGATFYPGGVDDFYMPEVISPAPQRIMPEVPENMQHNLAHLEQEANRPEQYHNQIPPRQDIPNFPHQHTQNNQSQSQSYLNSAQGQGQFNEGGRHQQSQQTYGPTPSFEPIEEPSFSRFPLLRNPPPNVPPTPEQKEATLEAARLPVMESNDALNQMDWAQDTLAYVEEAIQNEQRINNQPAASVKLSRIRQSLKDDAMNVILFLADQKHPRALVLKGIWLEFGKFDYAVDKRQAWECYKAAANHAMALSSVDPARRWGGRAQYRMGMQFENSKDVVNALKHYRIGVDAGDSAACYRLGMMVLLGQHGQTQDFQAGLDLIFAAAQNADENAPQGAYVLGMLQARELPQVTISDRFLPRDIGQARINIERAAFLGFAKAQVKMGSAYELCELGCQFSPALSLHYNNLAARQGEVEAELAISKWFLAGQEGVFEKDEEMAFTYAQRAAQDELPTAQFAMGYYFEIGIYMPVNLHVAMEWYRKSAANGNADARARIESLSRSKTLSRKDHERIAVSKIKESRLQSPTEPVPPIPSMAGTIDMPDPARLNLHSPVSSGSDQYGNSGRQSVAPYPANDDFGPSRPGMVSHSSNLSNPEIRPASAFGIKLPNPEIRPASAFGINLSSPEIRPASAFGINPNLRASSAATIAGTRPDQQYRPGGQEQGGLYPQYETGPGYGRGGRIASGPPQQGYAGPGRGGPPPNQQGSPQLPPKVDIGYLAPLDASGADRRKRLQKSESPTTARPPQRPSTNPPPSSRPQRTPQSHAPAIGGSPHPPRMESMPPKPLPQQTRPPPAMSPAPAQPAAQRPAPASVKPAAATRPPGKGPQTFEEMGVPAGKGKDDCIVM